MKELSIEEKAKRYDEALTKARNIVNSINVGLIGKDSFESVFPELAENDSEDERVRKELLNAFLGAEDSLYMVLTPQKRKSILAWLEKQGKNTYNKELSELLHKVICRFINDPDIPYSDREKVSMKVLPYVERLEKQGEQKPQIKLVFPKFRVGDIIQHIPLEKWDKTKKITHIDETGYYFDHSHQGDTVSGGFIGFSFENEYELVEQKPADKIKTKFKVGDWVVCKNGSHRVFQVIERSWPNAKYLDEKGAGGLLNVATLDKQYRPWTIQDAKEGDVLADDYGIYIFEKFDECDKNCYVCIGAYQYSQKVYECEHMLCSTDAHPATKEQRDLLFQKMKEAGYEWDAENKQLRKIELKSTEDVNLPEFESYLCLMLQKFRTKGMCTNGEIIDYVKEHSQKLRDILVKSSWSEEDEEIYRKCICAMRASACGFPEEENFVEQVDNWFKSLKDKVQSQNK